MLLLLIALRSVTVMLIMGGNLISKEQLVVIGERRGIEIKTRSHVARLNMTWRSKGITSVRAIPVCHPRGMPNEPGENWVIIASDQRLMAETHPMHVKPIEEPTEGAESKKWLEINGITDGATVVDPYFEFGFTENGEVAGDPMMD